MRQWVTRQPPELVVYDSLHDCPYLPDRDARLPMRLPSRALQPDELDRRLAEGDRRHGAFLYRPTCPGCQACEAIRIPIADFRFSKSHRRTLRKGDAALTLELGPPRVDLARVTLYDKHKTGRDLRTGEGSALSLEGYRGFLVERCVDAFELRYRIDGELVAVAVVDRGETALSAVYCYWDPAHKKLGIGTYSVLKQVELCQQWGMSHLYLGLYIADNPHMSYKARYLPHERRVDGQWRRFER
ncbi:MAG: arginyltransferase [Sandaracinaceae bacterium]